MPTQPSAVGNVKLWRRAKGTKCLGLMLETFPGVTPIFLGGRGIQCFLKLIWCLGRGVRPGECNEQMLQCLLL